MFNIFDSAKSEQVQDGPNVFRDFLLNSGLYDSTEINEENLNDWLALLNGEVGIQCHCVECGQPSVFRMNPVTIVTEDHKGTKNEVKLGGYLQILRCGRAPGSSSKDNRASDWRWHNDYVKKATEVLRFSYHCAMHESHRIEFIVETDATSIRKIGQIPSVADLSFPELKEYRKVLSKEDMGEIRRAIGLNAQGIGVGSYVYLRRILERVIEKAKSMAIEDGKVIPEGYDRMKVVDRIKVLKDYLPDVFVNNPSIYGIVSKGIHELSEDDCKKYFPVLKECIFLILEKWEKDRNKRAAEKRLAAALSDISSKVK